MAVMLHRVSALVLLFI